MKKVILLIIFLILLQVTPFAEEKIPLIDVRAKLIKFENESLWNYDTEGLNLDGTSEQVTFKIEEPKEYIGKLIDIKLITPSNGFETINNKNELVLSLKNNIGKLYSFKIQKDKLDKDYMWLWFDSIKDLQKIEHQ